MRRDAPGLFHLFADDELPRGFRLLAASRRPLGDDDVRRHARESVEQFGRGGADGWDAFAGMVRAAHSGDDGDLPDRVAELRRELPEAQVIFYLSVPPEGAEAVIDDLAATGLADDAKVIFEKPFGEDVRSARSLHAAVARAFSSDRVFRIDHFLGKRAVQNLLAMRFANGLLEPAWNRTHVAEIQIDAPETLSIEGRAEFYESTGALRDMIVSHLLQVLGFVAVEPPASLSPADLHTSRLEVVEALTPLDPGHVVRGQYAGYRDEEGVDPSSKTETLRRIAGGDRQRALTRRAVLPAHRQEPGGLGPARDAGAPLSREARLRRLGRSELDSDRVLFDLSDPGAVELRVLSKQPGTGFAVASARMRMELKQDGLLEAYERLLLDAMAGTRPSSPTRGRSSACGRSPSPSCRTHPNPSRTRWAHGGRRPQAR